jgi:hypothetical protein
LSSGLTAIENGSLPAATVGVDIGDSAPPAPISYSEIPPAPFAFWLAT